MIYIVIMKQWWIIFEYYPYFEIQSWRIINLSVSLVFPFLLLLYHIKFSILKVEYGEGKIKKMEEARCSLIWGESVSSTRSCCSSTRRIKERRQKGRSSQTTKINIQVCWSNFEVRNLNFKEFWSKIALLSNT